MLHRLLSPRDQVGHIERKIMTYSPYAFESVELIRRPSRGDDSISALKRSLGDLPPKPP